MKKCNKCNIEVNSIRKTCPLCLAVLERDEQIYEKKYPSPFFVPRRKSLLLRILAFISIVSILISVIVNIMTYKKGQTMWSVIVSFNIGYFWLLIKSTFKKKGNVPIRLVVQTLAISLLIYIIDFFTGNEGWAINYAIPFIAMLSLLSIISLSIGTKKRYINYFLHIITAIIIGFFPIIFWLFGLVDVFWPSLASAMFSGSCFIGVLIIGDKDTREEIKKRFHI